MIKSALFSIHPTHLNNILKGSKIFEYRRQRPKCKVSHIAFYCTTPVNMIVAVAEVIDTITDKPSRIWDKTSFASGLPRAVFREYFHARSTANAFVLGKVYKLSTPLPLRRLTGPKAPPQSFCYLNDNDISIIMDHQELTPAVPPALFFIGGIHGVGKTTLCTNIFNLLGYEYYAASSLINAQTIQSSHEKKVLNIPDNQASLLHRLSAIKSQNNRIFLDGHFTLLNQTGEIEPINMSVFEIMKPTGLILIKDDPCEIAFRLKQRDGFSWDQTFLEHFQTIEEQHAVSVSNYINIPLHILINNKKITSSASLLRKVLRPAVSC